MENIMYRQLSKIQLQSLLQSDQIDMGSDTLFGYSNLRDPNTYSLTLVVGLGGSGNAVLSEVINVAEQKLKEEYKKYVKFFMIDSSAAELALYTINNHSVIKTLNISDGEIDKKNSYVKEIIPQDIPCDPTGLYLGNRVMNRCRLLYGTYHGKSHAIQLMDMIKQIFNTEWAAYSSLPVNIIMITSLSGGMGSGTFIDVPILIKEACPDKNNVRSYGYLMLPDTTEHYSDNTYTRNMWYCNGFAALKELESYYSMLFEPDWEETLKIEPGNSIKSNYLNLPIDYPILISGNYYTAVTTITNAIISEIADSQGTFDMRSHFGCYARARIDAIAQEYRGKSDVHGILAKDAYPEDSHMYSSIGYAKASIPEKIIIPNIIGKVCKKLTGEDVTGFKESDEDFFFCGENKPLTKFQFEKAIQIIWGVGGEIRADSLWNKINWILERAGQLNENEIVITPKDIIQGNIHDFYAGFHSLYTINEAMKKLENEFNDLYRQFLLGIQTVMEQHGPRAIQYLYEGDGYRTQTQLGFDEISIKNQLLHAERELLHKRFTHGEYPPTHIENIIAFILKNSIKDWMKQAYEATQTDIYCEIAKRLTDIWQQYVDKITKVISNCIRFADIFDIMAEEYERAGKVFDDSFIDFSRTTDEPNGINLCQTEKMYRWVKLKIDAKLASINLNAIKQDLIADFMGHQAEWMSIEPGVARRRFALVMSQSCKLGKYATAADGLHFSVTDYFNEILDGIDDPNLQVEAIRKELTLIILRLRNISRPSLKINSSIQPWSYENLFVPEKLISGTNGPLIENEFISLLGSRAKFHTLSASDAIECYQMAVALPLYGLTDIQMWEKGYEAYKGSPKLSTCHRENGHVVTKYTELTALMTDNARGNQFITRDIDDKQNWVCGTGLSWLNYPSVNLVAYGGDFSKKEIEELGVTQESNYRVEVFDKKIEYALREKIIEYEKWGDSYIYYINLIPEDWDNLDVENYISDTISLVKGKYSRGAILFDFLAAQNPKSVSKWRRLIRLQGSDFFDSPFDFSEVIRAEHWTAERIAKEHKSYMKRMMRKNVYLYRQLQETLYRYEGIRRKIEAAEEKYINQYCIELFIDLYTFGIVFSNQEDLEWRITTSLSGVTSLLFEVTSKLKAISRGVEHRLLIDEFYFVLAYWKFYAMVESGELKLDELDELKEEIITNMPQEDFEEKQRDGMIKMQNYMQRIYDKYGNTEKPINAVSVAYQLSGVETQDLEILESFLKVVESNVPSFFEEEKRITDGNYESNVKGMTETSWDCPECGNKGIKNKWKFCPECGAKKPGVEEERDWYCPDCGSKVPSKFKFCYECAKNSIRPGRSFITDTWDCLECGNKGIDDNYIFCPECGTKRPVKTKQERQDWACPECGKLDINGKYRFCPECGFKKG